MPGTPFRVLRGGSFNNNAQNLRAAYRNNNHPENDNNNIGFRVVWSLAGGREIAEHQFGSASQIPLPRTRPPFGSVQ